jgi:hypothetical protein
MVARGANHNTFILAEPEVASRTPTPTGSHVSTPALEEAEEGHALSTPKAKFPTSEVEEAFQMAQQVDVAQALAAMGNAITGLTQAINQIIAGPPQQHCNDSANEASAGH